MGNMVTPKSAMPIPAPTVPATRSQPQSILPHRPMASLTAQVNRLRLWAKQFPTDIDLHWFENYGRGQLRERTEKLLAEIPTGQETLRDQFHDVVHGDGVSAKKAEQLLAVFVDSLGRGSRETVGAELGAMVHLVSTETLDEDGEERPPISEHVLAAAIEAMLADPKPVYGGRSPGEVLDACLEMRATLLKLYRRASRAITKRPELVWKLRCLEEEDRIDESECHGLRRHFRHLRNADREASFEEILERARKAEREAREADRQAAQKRWERARQDRIRMGDGMKLG